MCSLSAHLFLSLKSYMFSYKGHGIVSNVACDLFRRIFQATESVSVPRERSYYPDSPSSTFILNVAVHNSVHIPHVLSE